MLGLPLAFAAPAILAALAALPVLWWLLRVTPPQPRRVPFPPLALFPDLIPEKRTPARTPWWLLAMRMAIAALVILAAAGPVWQPQAGEEERGRGPLLLIVDNGAASARDWADRMALLAGRISGAERDGRPVALLATADAPGDLRLLTPALALERARALRPQAYLADPAAHLPSIRAFLATQREAGLVWISDGLAPGAVASGAEAPPADAFSRALAEVVAGRSVTIHAAPGLPLALAGIANRADGLGVTLLRPGAAGAAEASVTLRDGKGLVLGRAPARFEANATRAEAAFALPLELRNAATRAEIDGEASALAVALIDDQGRRRRIGLIHGGSADTAQPLVSPTYYVARALAPFADLSEPRGGIAETVARLVAEQASVIVLADVGALDTATTRALEGFVERGGVVIRFAGARLASAGDTLTPVTLRRGGRSLGGSLSWEAPKTLAPFPATSPFANLTPPTEVSVTRQILAEPGPDLTPRVWAALADGTPIVTGERRGQGHVVLFHVTADPSWSSLPLSGLFVEMLRNLVALAGKPADPASGNTSEAAATAAPRMILDGFGIAGSPPATAKSVTRGFAGRAIADHPAGFYGPAEASLAVNVLRAGDIVRPADFGPLGSAPRPIRAAEPTDLRAPLIALAVTLLALDTFVLVLLGGGLASLGWHTRRATTATLAVCLAAGGLWLATAPSSPSLAQALVVPPSRPTVPTRPPVPRAELEAAGATRLAYVLTGDTQVDETSRAGLLGLTRALSLRTAFEPADPVGIDPGRDELAFYPLIYWPVVPGRPLPGEAAMRRIDAYMKGGGTIVFDTRDAGSVSAPGQVSPATQHLRRMLSTLTIPELEPLPRDHVLTKAFYLIQELPGRYASGRTWIESLPPAPDGEARPARSGDGISPVLITGNDLAAAWAVGRNGEPLFPMVGGGERQRELALRGGINLAMYALTGNYKTDQVHVGPLLERLGQ